MNQPIIKAIEPMMYDLDQSLVYLWCVCGRCHRGALCDGSHAVTGLKPLKFAPEKTGRHALCMCKQTQTPPYCDGTHQAFTTDQIGTTLKE